MHQNSFPYNSSYQNTTKCILPRYIISIIHCRTFWWNASKYILAKYNKTYAKYILPDKNQNASHPQYIKRQSDEIHHNKTHQKSPINKHTTKILPAKFIKMNPFPKNIKLHPTKVHQNASYQSASKCILPKHIKMHPTKACWVVIEVYIFNWIVFFWYDCYRRWQGKETQLRSQSFILGDSIQ